MNTSAGTTAATEGFAQAGVATKKAPSSPFADLLACVCGLITSLLTGVLLWFITTKFHFALHKMTFWFVIPVGALLRLGCGQRILSGLQDVSTASRKVAPAERSGRFCRNISSDLLSDLPHG